MIVLIFPLLFILRVIGIDASSTLGAFMMRKIGPLLPHTKYARRNIKFALPHLSEQEVEQILLGMWDNIGRVLFEFPHVYRLSNAEINKRIEIVGLANTKNHGQAIFLSGHFGNWEIAINVISEHVLKSALIYRKSNQPMANRIMTSMRSPCIMQIPKSVPSKPLLKAITAGYNILLLCDQKLREGLLINFFGKGARTSSLPAKLAFKYKLPIFFCRVIRVKGAYFKLYIEGPFFQKGRGEDFESEFTTKMNETYEAWIKEYPSQWFWLHRRWEKEFYS